VLRNIFGSRRDEVSGEWGRLHSEDIRDLYSLPNVILMIISRRTGVFVCGKCGVGANTGFGGET
jgi:hypothetical protein